MTKATTDSAEAAESDENTAGPASPARIWHGLYALGRAGLPERFEVGGRAYRLDHLVKHDFYAAVGFYDALDGDADRAVLKVARTTAFYGFPLRWLGRWLCRRETRMYRRLAGVRGVPALLGRVGPTGYAHAYVPGRPLTRGVEVPDGFFDDLDALLGELHRRELAYTDLNKPENVLLGDDGRPWLIDFQVAWDAELRWTWWWGWTSFWAFRRADHYHALKHKRRLRPDELTDAERVAVERGPLPVRAHRALSRPYFAVRKRLFAWLRRTGRVGPELSK